MTAVISKPDTQEKLRILSADAQYDLACACSSKDDPGRTRGSDGNWIYPVTLAHGGKTTLFKTLVSNVCGNDCRYCPLRSEMDIRRCSLSAEETVRVFLDHYRRKKVFGLFLSSGLCGSADGTMEMLNGTARILRNRHRYKGFIHLKIIPGASDAAVEEAVSLASAVSLNIETTGEERMKKLSSRKDYIRDIIKPIKLISRLTGKGTRYSRVKQTTQFIVGAADESDTEIVKYMSGLYDRLNMHRVYFSAYQNGLGDKELGAKGPGAGEPADTFMREHRLYQVDFLLRRYGFKEKDILFGEDGRLSLSYDPKEVWAKNHPEFFPVNANFASKFDLLRVPGLGPITVGRILQRRRYAKLHRIEEVGKVGVLLKKAEKHLRFT